LCVNAVITNVAAGYEAHVDVVPLHIATVFGNSSIVIMLLVLTLLMLLLLLLILEYLPL